MNPAGAEGGYDYFFNTSTTPYGTTYGGNSSVQYTGDGFFVMRYQASENSSDSGVPQSVSDKAGWNTIPFNSAGGSPNAYGACEALDSQTSGYDIHLTTNREWMTVARQVAQNSTNWADGTVGSTGSSGGLYQGNRDSAGGLDRAVNLQNYPDGVDYPNAADVGDATSDEVRTHVLSSGDRVWDLSGDLWMWVDAEEDGTTMSTNSSKIYEKNTESSTVSGGDGLGTDYGFDNGDAALRGGLWLNGDGAGVFHALSRTPDTSLTFTGFRCSAVPVS